MPIVRMFFISPSKKPGNLKVFPCQNAPIET